MKTLRKASLEEIINELEDRSLSFDNCFLGEALAGKGETVRETAIGRDGLLDDKRSISSRMIAWVFDGKILQSKAHRFVEDIEAMVIGEKAP